MARRSCPMLSFIFLLFSFGGWFYALTIANHDSCRRLKFLQQKDGYGLVGHVFRNISLPVGMHIYSHCRNWCTMEDRCKSINMGPSGEKDKVLCQLSDSDHLQHPNDLKPMTGVMYRGTENKCCFNMRYNNATCLVGFTDKGYKCLCRPGYTGEYCEKGGGGGGFYSSGRSGKNFNGTKGYGGEGGKGFIQGGVGGRAMKNDVDGGFGGGGGGGSIRVGGGGGGGGYSGGSSGNDVSDSCGGGGGSYNDGNNQDNKCCYNNAGHGQVAITFLE